MGALKGKYLWNTFISLDRWVMTHRGFKNGKLTSHSCWRWLHLMSQITGAPSRLAEVAIVWLFLSFPLLPFMSFLPFLLPFSGIVIWLSSSSTHLSSPPPPLVLGSPTVVMRCFIICISWLLIEREFRLSPGSSVRELPWETWQA